MLIFKQKLNQKIFSDEFDIANLTNINNENYFKIFKCQNKED